MTYQEFRTKYNKQRVDNDGYPPEALLIDISTPKYPNKFAIVDSEDLSKISFKKWSFRNDGYAFGTAKGRPIYMHRVIMQEPKGYEVDHINWNRLDNRKCNLRLVKKSENVINRPVRATSKSGYRGVHWCNTYQKWIAKIMLNQKSFFIGRFDDKKEAALAYNERAKELFGEYCYQNVL